MQISSKAVIIHSYEGATTRTFFVFVIGMQQPQFVVVEVRVSTSASPREESVRQNRSSSVEGIGVVMVASGTKQLCFIIY